MNSPPKREAKWASASDPTWERRSYEGTPCKSSGFAVIDTDDPSDLPPDKRPGSEGPRVKTR